jgi:hypothetical protein
MFTNSDAEPAPYQENSLPRGATRSRPTPADATLEFGQFRVLLRRCQLVADGIPIELGTRAFDLLLVLLDADRSLVTKGELLSRVWPGIVVAEDNLKFRSPHCQGSWRRPRFYPYRNRPRLSVYWHSSLGEHRRASQRSM